MLRAVRGRRERNGTSQQVHGRTAVSGPAKIAEGGRGERHGDRPRTLPLTVDRRTPCPVDSRELGLERHTAAHAWGARHVKVS